MLAQIFMQKILLKKKNYEILLFIFADKVIVNSNEFKAEFKKYFKINAVRIYNPLEDKKN